MLDRNATQSPMCTALILALAAVTTSGCGGNGAVAPTAASSSATVARASRAEALTHSIAGNYGGNIKDSVFGAGQLDAELSQYRDAVGGSFTFVYGSLVFIVPAAFLLKGSVLTGTGQIGNQTGGLCTVSETATYSSHQVSGTYKAVSGCSGETGTFSLKQECRYAPDSPAEPAHELKRC
jgi:hypothetical protein